MPATNTDSTCRWYLYTYPDGQRVIFELFGRYWCEALKLTYESQINLDSRFLEVAVPDDLTTLGQQITEERMRELTGYYLNGVDLLNEVTCLLERIRPENQLCGVADTLRELAQIALASRPA